MAAQPIGPSGGTLVSADGLVQITVPSGATSTSRDLSVQEITNMAPAGVGSAYRLGPDGTTFSKAVTLTFSAALVNGALDGITVAYQDGSGYWLRVPVVTRDESARTLTVETSHFSSWALVTGPSPRDLTGTFTVASTIGIPFTADAAAILSFAGEDTTESYYLLGGTEAPRSPITVGTTTCTADVPTLALYTNLAELMKSPVTFDWGTSGHWSLTCSDATTPSISYAFDTIGMNLIGCARGYVGVPTNGTDRVAGSYTIDCGSRGTLTGTWDFRSTVCGTACQPADPCQTGTWDCSSGAAVCTTTGTLANGTICGTNMVCSAGTCTSCTAGLACATQPDTLCHSGVTSCATGTSACVNGSALGDGTSCGTDMVCSGGACVACAAGQTCTAQPDPLCHSGVTSCSTGTSACVNGSALADGTSCGTDLVCSGGACTSCTAGLACATQPDTLCHSGVTSCSTGTSVCVNGSALADGTSCGTNMVCSAGTCVSCTAGVSCTPTNACHEGTTSCSTGSQTCTDLGTSLANGTVCGTGSTCNDGSCVASRTVTGTRLVTYWPDGTTAAAVPAPDVLSATVAALVPRAGGGFDTYTGTISVAGSISIPNVPVGTYILSFVDGAGHVTYLETSASTIDLGYDVLGRSGAVPATAATPVTLSLDGLTAWTAGTPGDEIQISSSNADVFDIPSRNATLTAGATTASLVDDWSASALGGPMNLLVAADVLYVHDLATGSITQTGGTTPYAYLAATNAVSVTGLAFTSGTPVTVPATLVAAPATGYVTGAATTGIAWPLTQFEAQLQAMTGLTAMPAGSVHTLSVGAAARGLVNPAPISTGTPTLFRLELPAGTGDFATAGGLAYGQFLDASWSEWRGVDFSVPVSYTLAPATAAFVDHASLGRREAMSATPPTPIVPALLPVQAPAVNGQGAFATLTGVGTTPTISWSPPPAPSLTPTSYTVEIVKLGVNGTATVTSRVARWRVTSTSLAVPPGVLFASGTYYARIVANSSSPDPRVTKPLSGEVVTAYATTLTGTFSP